MKITGTEIAKEVFKSLKDRIKKLKESNVTPHLVVILIGNDPASVVYVNQKEIKGKKIGVKIAVKNISANITQPQLIRTIEQFNNDNNIHGIIVQRPLPKDLNSEQISLSINPNKDIDGFHPNSKFLPPIALAVLRILEEIYFNNSPPRSDFVPPRRWPNGLLRGEFRRWLSSQKIIVIGKGQTGGKPVIEMLKKMNLEPSIIDSKTHNPESISKTADIIVSAVGKPDVIKPEMIKREVILIGVGLSIGSDGKLHGDYDEEKIKNIASFHTPTPGGVGPLNVAMLLENLSQAAENSK